MRHQKLVIALTLGLGLAGAIAVAANRGVFAPLPVLSTASAGTSAATPTQVGVASANAPGSLRIAAKPTPTPPPPTDADVGDAASYGRNVRWLGVAAGFVYANTDCAAILAEEPTAFCQQIADTTAVTQFSFTDIARITLPANATSSLLCHWFSPRVTVNFLNPGANPVLGRLSYNPTLTIENPALANPALIDPTTGAPFNGKFTTSMSAGETFTIALEPGMPILQNLRDSAVCQAGFVSRRALLDTYGLTAAQADAFFANPTTIRMNVSGNMRYADFVTFSLGLRVVGD